MRIFSDITGQRFGRLTCVERTAKRNKQREIMWLCKCDCGNEIVTNGSGLRRGSCRSCGCLQRDGMRDKSATHSLSSDENGNTTRLYKAWCNMKTRCLNPNTREYENYGGRGISVCESWKTGYVEFHNWAIRHGYEENLTLDRKDNDGNYEPNNCHWATNKEQQNNTRRNSFVVFQGETMTVGQLVDKAGVDYASFNQRLRRGWTVEKSLNVPFKKYKARG